MSEEEATDAPQGRKPDSSKFRAGKFTYHQEVEVDIATLTNLGDGLGRVHVALDERRHELQGIARSGRLGGRRATSLRRESNDESDPRGAAA